jgi:hypothetical protein
VSSEKKYWTVTGTHTITYETVIEAETWMEADDKAGDVLWEEWDVLDDKTTFEVATTMNGEPT